MVPRLSYVLVGVTLLLLVVDVYLSVDRRVGSGAASLLPVSAPASALTSSFPIRVAYEPSAAEVAWRANIATWHADVCARSASPTWFPTMQGVVTALAAQDAPGPDDALPASFAAELAAADAAGYLSHFVYTYADGSTARVAIEPLIGILRDPRSGCDGPSSTAYTPMLETLEKFWMHVDLHMWVLLDPELRRVANVGALLPPPAPPPPSGVLATLPRGTPHYARAFLLDMGGSRWNHAQGSRWTMRIFEHLGIRFDHIYVWEANPTESAVYYKDATADALSRIHFFNWPVSASRSAMTNPFELLKQIAVPADFVAVKLDIDAPDLELALVKQLLDDPQLQALVDEFFFEHHVKIADFDHWGDEAKGTLSDTYAIFAALREKGVHAHSWP